MIGVWLRTAARQQEAAEQQQHQEEEGSAGRGDGLIAAHRRNESEHGDALKSSTANTQAVTSHTQAFCAVRRDGQADVGLPAWALHPAGALLPDRLGDCHQ